MTRGSVAAVRVSANLHACRFYRLDFAPPPLRNTGDLLRKAADLNQSRFPLMRNPPDLVHGRLDHISFPGFPVHHLVAQ